VRDNGKLISEMLTQLRYIPEWYRYFGGLADKIEGGVLPIDKRGLHAYTRREPLGVIACITPWNSPCCCLPGSSLRPWLPATPRSSSRRSMLRPRPCHSSNCSRPRIPARRRQYRDRSSGRGRAALARHPDVAKIAFTGGESGGLHVYRAAAEGLKHISLELAASHPISSSPMPSWRTP